MTTRNIYIIGQGYNPTPVSAIVTVDGLVVHTGTIPTVDQPIVVSQAPNNSELQQEMVANKTAIFSIEKDLEFIGTCNVNIQAVDGPMWFGAVISNYAYDYRVNPNLTPAQQAIVTNPASTEEQIQQVRIEIANPPFTAEEAAIIESARVPYSNEIRALIHKNNAEVYWKSSGADNFKPLPDLDGETDDTWTSATINGVEQIINPNAFDPPLTGTWWWILRPGDVFQATLQIAKGIPLP
jgi:hypothetical protein